MLEPMPETPESISLGLNNVEIYFYYKQTKMQSYLTKACFKGDVHRKGAIKEVLNTKYPNKDASCSKGYYTKRLSDFTNANDISYESYTQWREGVLLCEHSENIFSSYDLIYYQSKIADNVLMRKRELEAELKSRHRDNVRKRKKEEKEIF